MNRKLSYLLAAWLAMPVALLATEAIQNIETLAFVSPPIGNEVGFSFKPQTNFTVTALGYRFNPSANAASYVVRLLNSNGTAVATATLSVPAATTNQLVYTNISPVLLAGGSTNYLLAYDALYASTNSGAKQWEGLVIDSRVPDSGSFSVAAEVGYFGARSGTGEFLGTNAPYFLLVGPNFQFTTGTVVQPSTLLISLTTSNTVRLSWPEADTLAHLQAAATLGVTMTNVSQSPVVVGTNKVVELPVVPPRAFFRLAY